MMSMQQLFYATAAVLRLSTSADSSEAVVREEVVSALSSMHALLQIDR